MLKVLFDSVVKERILLFLCRNTRGSATDMAKALHTNLFAVRSRLVELERGNVLLAEWVDGGKMYHLNAGYPLHLELVALLKKASEFESFGVGGVDPRAEGQLAEA